MPYLLLALGCLIGLYALYRFFLKADIRQIKALFLAVLLGCLTIALLYLALTGRLIAALALLVPLAPVLLSSWREWKKAAAHSSSGAHAQRQGKGAIGSRAEALEVLGLKEDADEEAVKQAYKKLMAKVHPDAQGSEWMAARLNEARDFLLKRKSK